MFSLAYLLLQGLCQFALVEYKLLKTQFRLTLAQIYFFNFTFEYFIWDFLPMLSRHP